MQSTVISGYVFGTLTALPTATAQPSATPQPTLTASNTATFTPSATSGAAATLEARRTQSVELETVVAATLTALPTSTALSTATAQPSATPQPTLTASNTATASPRPTVTPTYTPSPDIIRTQLVATDQSYRTYIPTMTAMAATRIANAVSETLTAQPTGTATPDIIRTQLVATDQSYRTYIPTMTAMAATRIANAVSETLTAQPTATLPPTLTASSTWTPSPNYAATQTVAAGQFQTQVAESVAGTLTAQPTDTLAPTFTASPRSTGTVTPDLFATATAIVQGATATAGVYFTETAVAGTTLSGNELTATSIVAGATQTAGVYFTETAVAGSTPSASDLTATSIIMGATATAGVYFTETAVVATPLPLATLSANQMTATAIVAGATQTATLQVGYATGTAAARATASSTPDLFASATAAQAAPVEVEQFGLSFTAALPAGWSAPRRLNTNTLLLENSVAQVFIYRGDAAYFESEWGIPRDETDLEIAADGLAERLKGTIQSYDGLPAIPILLPASQGTQGIIYFARLTDGWLILSCNAPEDDFASYRADVFDPLLASVDVVGPLVQFTPTPARPTLSAFALTATEFAQMIATPVVRTPLPTMTSTPPPTATPLPTATASPNWGATATAEVMGWMITASAVASAWDVVFTMPDGWSGPVWSDSHTLTLTDGTARIFVYRGDADYFAQGWYIPTTETDPDGAAAALAAGVGGTVESAVERAIPVLLNPKGDTQGILYLVPVTDGWVIVSCTAPKDQLAAYRTDVFEPLIQILHLTGALMPTASPTPEPTPVTFETYRSDDLGVSFDSPVGWTPHSYPSLNDLGQGMTSVLIYSNPDDINEDIPVPTAPAIVVLRVNMSLYQPNRSFASPEDMLVDFFDVPAEDVHSFATALYPAAHAFNEAVMDGTNTSLYALKLSNAEWLMLALVAPPDSNIPLMDETIMQPLVRSLEAFPVDRATPTPVVFQPYDNDMLGVSAQVPAGWGEQFESDLGDMEAVAVLFFSNPLDMADSSSGPGSPALAIMRFISPLNESPESFLSDFVGAGSGDVTPFDGANYPTLRLEVESDENNGGVVYLLMPEDGGWVLVLLAAPAVDNIPLLDETIAQPVVRSVEIREPVLPTMTVTPLPPTYTPVGPTVTASPLPPTLPPTPTP